MATKNNFTTLVSVRLDNDVVVRLESVVKRNYRLNRSFVINYLLKGILNHATDSDVDYMISTGLWTRSEWKIKIERS